MRLSEFASKRILNLYDGEIIGEAGHSDLLFRADTGEIVEIVVPPIRGVRSHPLSIPWSAVQKVGAEMIVVDIEV